MKNSIIVIAILLAFASCEKEPIEPEFQISEYYGYWMGENSIGAEMIVEIDSTGIIIIEPYTKRAAIIIEQNLGREYWSAVVNVADRTHFYLHGLINATGEMEVQQIKAVEYEAGKVVDTRNEPGDVYTLFKRHY